MTDAIFEYNQDKIKRATERLLGCRRYRPIHDTTTILYFEVRPSDNLVMVVRKDGRREEARYTSFTTLQTAIANGDVVEC